MTTAVFHRVALVRPAGADMAVSYHSANWTSLAFCMIGMLYTYSLPFHCSYKFPTVLAFILGVLFFRGVGVVGHREPKTTSAEEREKVGDFPPKEQKL